VYLRLRERLTDGRKDRRRRGGRMREEKEKKNRTDTPLVHHSMADRKSLLEINSVWVQQLSACVFTLKVRWKKEREEKGRD